MDKKYGADRRMPKEKSLEKRFSVQKVQEIVDLLESGYEVESFNNFQGGSYYTFLKNGNGDIRSFDNDTAWPFIITDVDSNYQVASIEHQTETKSKRQTDYINKFKELLKELQS